MQILTETRYRVEGWPVSDTRGVARRSCWTPAPLSVSPRRKASGCRSSCTPAAAVAVAAAVAETIGVAGAAATVAETVSRRKRNRWPAARTLAQIRGGRSGVTRDASSWPMISLLFSCTRKEKNNLPLDGKGRRRRRDVRRPVANEFDCVPNGRRCQSASEAAAGLGNHAETKRNNPSSRFLPRRLRVCPIFWKEPSPPSSLPSPPLLVFASFPLLSQPCLVSKSDLTELCALVTRTFRLMHSAKKSTCCVYTYLYTSNTWVTLIRRNFGKRRREGREKTIEEEGSANLF